MASKVLIKMPVSFNSQIGKKSTDIIRSDNQPVPCVSSDPLLRISQLEQKIRFLQEQHQAMLSSLHQEIESLRSRNRDLQFQLIFGKNSIPISLTSSDSSPDDSGKPKIVLSPKEVNTRSLHVEILEREVTELKSSLTEANTKNTTLTQLVETQKKQLEAARKEKVENDYTSRLDEADNLIKCLIKENEEQHREIVLLRNQQSKNIRYNGGQGGGPSSVHSRRGGGGEHSGSMNNHQHFPPLQSHNYWGNNSQRHRNSPDYTGRRSHLDHEVIGQAAASLPHLTRAYSQNSSHNRSRYYSNGNHFYRSNTSEGGEGRRKYRGRGTGNSKEGGQ